MNFWPCRPTIQTRLLIWNFVPLTCRACVDDTNVLADIAIGYMDGQGEQWLIVRNDRGTELLELSGREIKL